MKYSSCIYDCIANKILSCEFDSDTDNYTEDALLHTPETTNLDPKDNITWIESFNGYWSPVESHDADRKNEALFLIAESEPA